MVVTRSAAVGVVFLAGAVFAVGQRGQQPSQPIQQPTQTMPESPSRFPSIDGRMPPDSDGLPPSVLARQAKMRNDDRQRQMISDADKLVELAAQLKEEVNKDGGKASSDDVGRKAEEIEKLAKSVKDRMKG